MNLTFKIFSSLVIIFLVAFPKGGFDINEIPITWGYLLFSIVMLHGYMQFLFSKSILKIKALTFLSLSPFIGYYLIFLLQAEKIETGMLLSYILNFIIFPFFFILCFDSMERWIVKNFNFFLKIIISSILFISIFGIIHFLFKSLYKIDIEIPYLTVNIKDFGAIDSKNNYRGDGIYKLVSTYSNGNIFGLSALFLLPFTINHKLAKIALKICMILTLSRSVWFGLLIYEILCNRKRILHIVIYLTLFIAPLITIIIFFILNKNIEFIFDPTLNGRIKPDTLKNISIVFKPDFFSSTEMMYFSIIEGLGIVGIFLFLIYFFSPSLISYLFNSKNFSAYQKRMLIGIITYLLVAFIESAFILIPVGLFFWFANSFVLINSKRILYNE